LSASEPPPEHPEPEGPGIPPEGLETPAAAAVPVLDITITGVEPVRFAAAPTLRFSMLADDASGHEIHAVPLTIQMNIDPAKRPYDAETREKLHELFGDPERWGATTRPFVWLRREILVQSFKGATGFTFDVQCTYDLELAAVKYFYALPDGEVPLTFHFSGSVIYRGEHDRLQVTQVPWASETSFRMPVAAWQAMIEEHYPGRGWVALPADTLAELHRYRADQGHHTFDAAISELLAAARSETPADG
jgi:hypothetical protein